MLLRFLKQTGLSLVQGLVIGSVVSGSALIATRLIQDQKKLSRSVETRDQIEQLHRVIYGILQNREHCGATIAVISSPTPFTYANVTLGSSFTVPAIYTKSASGASQMAFQSGTSAMYMNNKVRIESMTLRAPTASDPGGLAYPAKLVVDYVRFESGPATRSGTGLGGKRIRKEIPIILQRAPGNMNCYATQMGETVNGQTNDGNNNINQEFCSNLGTNGSLYVWDSATNRCILKNNICPDKFVFAGISSTGTAICNPLNNYLNQMIDTTAISSCNTTSGATVQLAQDSTGRVRIICTP